MKLEDLLPDPRTRAIQMLRTAFDPKHNLPMSEIARGFDMEAIREHLATITTQDVFGPSTEQPAAPESVQSVTVAEPAALASNKRATAFRMTPDVRDGVREMVIDSVNSAENGATIQDVKDSLQREYPGITPLVIGKLIKEHEKAGRLRGINVRPKRWVAKSRRGKRAAV